jgi:ubiquinone biosynthesis monooxygenase Coq7
MRINHAGEVAAQALYYGQALVAKSAEVHDFLMDAAHEEGDHLSWCATRLNQLGAKPSVLNPIWFAGSAAIGAIAGLAGDRISLGFITETERQVEAHLSDHLSRLPAADHASRAIIEQMKADEVRHGQHAHDRGGQTLPAPIRQLMSATSRIMTLGAGMI